MSLWRFSSFFNGIWTAFFGGDALQLPQQTPEEGPGAVCGAAVGPAPQAVPAGRGRGPRMGSQEGDGEGWVAGRTMLHLTSICQVSILLCAPNTTVRACVFSVVCLKELGTFSNMICGNVFHCSVFNGFMEKLFT